MVTPFKAIRKRLLVVMSVTLLLFFILILRLGKFMIVEGEELKKKALEQWVADIEITPKRGIIYDRKGSNELALSVGGYKIESLPNDIEDFDAVADKLASLLEMDRDELYNKISSGKKYVKLKEWVNKDIGEKVLKENLKGIVVVENSKRFYPSDNLASQVLGFTNIDNVGLYGVERIYDRHLSGVPGRLIINTDTLGRRLPYDKERLTPAVPGSNVVLTIDKTLQYFAEKASKEALDEYKAKRTTVIIMEPNTGEILAMTSKPDFNPNEPRFLENSENLSQDEIMKNLNNLWKIHPITDIYEPGSTFKIITAAAGLEENIVNPNSQFYNEGYVLVQGVKIKDWAYPNFRGNETFKEGLEQSSNPVFVEVGLKLGSERFLNYLKAFGYGEKTGIDLPGESSGLIPSNHESIKDIELATFSFGQGIAVTPIQLISSVSAVVNGGNLIEPRIVKTLLDEDGNVLKNLESVTKRTVLSKRTSDTMLELLESVVTEGTGKKAFVPGYRVGGKTGTAQKVIDGKYSEDKYVASFIGVAPIENPKMVVLVIVDEPNYEIDYHGGTVAAPIAGRLIEDALKYLDIKPSSDY